jgi:hypothetical protein
MERAAKRRQIAILDFIMPRLDGVEAALLLRRDCPSTRVAVQSSDPDGLKERAAGLGLAVFDKLDVESLLAWVERQAGVWNGLGSTTVAALAPRRDVSCSQCGYGVVSREPPKRCPMCDHHTTWEAAVSEAPDRGFRRFG